MPKSRRSAGLVLLCLLLAPALSAQSATTVASGTLLAVENSKSVDGVRIRPQPDGTVWFLIPPNDRIVQLQSDGKTMKQWQIRADADIGASPVDFQVDGNIIWFIENGESLIDAGRSVFARLDTTTGALREWIAPGSVPAGFYLTPDKGTVWLPMSNGRLEAMDLNSLQVVDYRSTQTFAYSGLAVAPDGTFWMTDFGDNRIVHYKPGDSSETSWTFYDPNVLRLNPAQIQFDDQGQLWIPMLAGQTVDSFDPSTGVLAQYAGFVNPIHLDIFAGRIYIAEAPADKGRVAVLDPLLALGTGTTLTSQTLTVGSSINKLPALIRDSTITPTIFTATPAALTGTDLTTTLGSIGVLETQYGLTNAYGIAVDGGTIWVGADGGLQRLVLQTIGSASDLTVPVATEFGVSPGTRITTDVTLYNAGSLPISGNILYMYSPAAFAASTKFTIAPGETQFLADALQGASSNSFVLFGPVRINVTAGNAGDLSATVRSSKLLDDGSSYGFSMPALSSAASLNQGATRTLFTGNRASEAPVFGLFSPAGGQATATLLAPDGTVRGTRAFSLASNIAEEFNPAASAFGVSSEPGDVIVVSVTSGSLQPYVNVLDTGSFDLASSLPVAPTKDAVIPNLGTVVGIGDTSFVSDLFLSNSAANPANLAVSFFPAGSSDPPLTATLSLAPGASQVIEDVLGTLFSITDGQGALLVSSDVPVAVSSRVAARHPEGDYATFVAALDGSQSVPDAGTVTAFGVTESPTRRTHLLLFNRGSAGTVTITGYDAQGNQIGTLSVDMAAQQAVRVNSVMEQLGATDTNPGRISVTPDSGMILFAETAAVDADTGDVEIARLQ